METMMQHSQAIEQLKQLGTFWIGQDISLEQSVTVPPRNDSDTRTSILLNKTQLPNIEITRGALESLKWSARSFLAQSGINPTFHQSNLTDEMIQKLKDGETVPVPIDIANHGQRAVVIDGPCMRFFWADVSKRLQGNELRDAIGTQIVLDGVEGVDWELRGLDLPSDLSYVAESYAGEKDAISIRLPLGDKKFYIPASEEPLHIQSRKELGGVLTEIPEGLNLNFRIGETTKVKLGDGIMGVIDTLPNEDHQGRHIFSPLIDPGFEGKIRTEIEGTLDYIELFIYRK